jgi:hypothetical protein
MHIHNNIITFDSLSLPPIPQKNDYSGTNGFSLPAFIRIMAPIVAILRIRLSNPGAPTTTTGTEAMSERLLRLLRPSLTGALKNSLYCGCFAAFCLSSDLLDDEAVGKYTQEFRFFAISFIYMYNLLF